MSIILSLFEKRGINLHFEVNTLIKMSKDHYNKIEDRISISMKPNTGWVIYCPKNKELPQWKKAFVIYISENDSLMTYEMLSPNPVHKTVEVNWERE